jgi:hypothetical protein
LFIPVICWFSASPTAKDEYLMPSWTSSVRLPCLTVVIRPAGGYSPEPVTAAPT